MSIAAPGPFIHDVKALIPPSDIYTPYLVNLVTEKTFFVFCITMISIISISFLTLSFKVDKIRFIIKS